MNLILKILHTEQSICAGNEHPLKSEVPSPGEGVLCSVPVPTGQEGQRATGEDQAEVMNMRGLEHFL